MFPIKERAWSFCGMSEWFGSDSGNVCMPRNSVQLSSMLNTFQKLFFYAHPPGWEFSSDALLAKIAELEASQAESSVPGVAAMDRGPVA